MRVHEMDILEEEPAPRVSASAAKFFSLPSTGMFGRFFMKEESERSSFRQWVYAAAWITLLSGFLGMVGWVANWPMLAQIHPQSVLLSVRASLVFLVIGPLLLLRFNRPASKWVPWLFTLSGCGMMWLALNDDHTFRFMDDLLLPVLVRNLNSWEYVYRDRMAPITASTVVLLGFMVMTFPLAQRWRLWRDGLGLTLCIVILVHFVALTGFTYGVPFRDPRGYKPISFLGCIGTLSLSASYLGSLGIETFPMRFFTGKSIRAILWRTFLPMGAASIFVYAILDHTVFARMNMAMSSLLAMFLATLIVSLLIAQSTYRATYSIEESLRYSESRFTNLVQSLKGHAIYMVGPNGNILTWNQSAETLQGFESGNVLGKSFELLFGEEEIRQKVPSDLLLQAATKGVASGTFWHRKRDGLRFWAEDVISAIYDDRAQVIAYSVVTRDISIRRQAEELQRERSVSADMLQFVSGMAHQASDLQDVVQKTLEQICDRLHMPVGHAWEVYPESAQLRSYVWVTSEGNEWKSFRAAAEKPTLHLDQDLPGEVLRQRRLVVAAPASICGESRARAAQQAGLVSAFAFPVGVAQKTVFVFEFFSTREQPFSSWLQQTCEQIGLQLGHWIERARAMERLTVSLHEKEILLKEIHHRVKNNLQIISSLFRLQTDQMKNPEILNKFRESHDRVRSMALIHEYLYQSNDLERVPIKDYIQSLVSNLFRSYGVDPADIHPVFSIGDAHLNLDVAIPCGLILTELVSNVLKYAFPNNKSGVLRIGLSETGPGRYRLSVEDNGVGLPVDFAPENGRSLGLRLVHVLARQINGEVKWWSDAGAHFEITMTHMEHEGEPA